MAPVHQTAILLNNPGLVQMEHPVIVGAVEVEPSEVVRLWEAVVPGLQEEVEEDDN